MPGKNRRKRGRRKNPSFIFMAIMFLVLLGLGFCVVGMPLLERWLPSREYKDLNEWFEVSGDEVRIYLDFKASDDYTALASDGEVYLPYGYVSESLNGRFYWNADEELLTYTLPLEVVDFDAASVTDGAASFLVRDGEPFLSSGLICTYTNITCDKYIDGTEAAKRIFIHTGGTSVDTVCTSKNTFLRTSGDKKAPILTGLAKDEVLYVTDLRPTWSRAATGTGYVGYVDSGCLRTDEVSSCTYPVTYEEPVVPYVSLDEKLVLGFQAVYSAVGSSDFYNNYNNTGGAVNAVTPQFLQISDADGGLTDLTSREYIAAAHAEGVLVWPSVDNINQDGGIHDFDTGEFFAGTARRRGFISKLIRLALDYGYDGLNLDFESISPDAGESFTQFFRELSVECHKNNLALSIDNYVPYHYNDHYNLPEQGIFADYVIIMCYDEHTGSDIGPVASLSYTEYGITKAIESVPAGHVAAALPFYTRVWRTNEDVVSSEAMGMRQASQYTADNAIALSWDDTAGAYYGETTIGTGKVQLWVEDATSLSAKVELIKNYDIGGLAVWRLGLEPASVWDVLDLNRDDR